MPGMAIELGERVAGRYRIESRLGSGGMGVVYLARDDKLEREVALKALSSAQLGDTRGRSRLMREARSVAKLSHPGVVQVYDVVETDDGGACIVMERVRGHSLRELLEEGPPEVEEAARLVAEIGDALGAAHDEGIVHRDVKPDNAMVRDDGRVVVLDFGLVKDVGRSGDVDGRSPTLEELTQSGAIIGTPAYVAPEQARGKGVEPASDQFALAVSAYELLTGSLPFEADTPTQMLAMILMDDPPPASSLRSELPPEADAVLARALSKKPEDRFADVRDFAEALVEALGVEVTRSAGRTSTGRHPRVATPVAEALATTALLESAAQAPPTPGRRRTGWALLAGLVVAGATAGAVALWATPDEQAADEPETVPTPLGEPDAVLACPILEVEGLEEPTGWLGAAAADLLCRRAEAMLGGRPGSTVSPAEGLDLPELVNDRFPAEPFEGPEPRARTLDAARDADARIDGRVEYQAGRFVLDLELLAPGGRVAVGRAEASSLQRAVIDVLDGWAEGGAVPLAGELDEGAVRWTALTSVQDGLRLTDFLVLFRSGDVGERCRSDLPWLIDALPGIATQAAAICAAFIGPTEVPEPELDDSSPERIVQTLGPVAASLPDAEAERVAGLLEEARSRESRDVDRAMLVTAQGTLWAQRGDNERAIPLLQEAVRLNPRSFESRMTLGRAMFGGSGFTENARAMAAWSPSVSEAWRSASLFEEDAARRTELLRRAALLGPGQALMQTYYGDQLVRMGRREEARAVASRMVVGGEHLHLAGVYLEALVLADEARFARALSKTTSALGTVERMGYMVNADVFPWLLAIAVAEVLGRREEIAEELVERFVLAEPHRLATHDMYYEQLVGPTCIYASPPVAHRCLDRFEELARGRPGGTLPPIEALIAGARKYVDGDMVGAAEQWRPIAGQPWAPVPVDAFEEAGMPELVERVERKRLEQPMFTGVSMAHAREARRALERGDHARARELAELVIERWGVADAHVPAVDEMRELLERLPAE